MITQFRVQNFKALRDVTLDLTPIHVLIGPNDSGKTSILQAIAALSRSVDCTIDDAFPTAWDGLSLVWEGKNNWVRFAAAFGGGDAGHYELGCEFPSHNRGVNVVIERVQSEKGGIVDLLDHPQTRSALCRLSRRPNTLPSFPPDVLDRLECCIQNLSGVHCYRWNPSMLALPVAIDRNRGFRMDETGFGLAQCLDEIIGYDRRRFGQLEHRFCEIFPQFETIRLVSESAYKAPPESSRQPLQLQQADGKGIRFKKRNSEQEIPASQVSDGALLILAYLAVMHIPHAPRFLLLEEPENGIHPARIDDVIAMLRQLAKEHCKTQVILTTHSSYVVDQFAPEEVTLCRMRDNGEVAVRRLSESSAVERQKDFFTLGEIWIGEGDERLSNNVQDAPTP